MTLENDTSRHLLTEEELDEVAGGASKTVAKREKRQIEGRDFEVERHSDGTLTRVLPADMERIL